MRRRISSLSNPAKISLVAFLVLVQVSLFEIAFHQGPWMIVSSPSPDSVLYHQKVNLYDNSLSLPMGQALPLPSLLVNDTSSGRPRDIYGGEIDKPHLGGFTEIDINGLSPAVWTYMVQTIGIKSVLDVGCGRGISTTWFLMHNVDALCIEGSHDAYLRSMLPDKSTQMVEHDFTRGPYWPEKTYDAVWSVEFLEHVGRNYMKNYIPSFRKAALLFATRSKFGGWHHVEVHEEEWWILKLELHGFKYSPELTSKIRQIAKADRNRKTNITGRARGDKYNASHIWLTMMIFINPLVGTLPEHAHLMAEEGCYQRRDANGTMIHRPCGTRRNREESKLPDEFKPITIRNPEERLKDWEEWVKHHIHVSS
jgi:hypothetical protein